MRSMIRGHVARQRSRRGDNAQDGPHLATIAKRFSALAQLRRPRQPVATDAIWGRAVVGQPIFAAVDISTIARWQSWALAASVSGLRSGRPRIALVTAVGPIPKIRGPP
jgi:hypothetical protein